MSCTKGQQKHAEVPAFSYVRRVAKAALFTATSVALTITSFTASAGKAHTFTEYVPVVRVVPMYRDVTVREPQRICTPLHYQDRHHQDSHHYQRRNRDRYNDNHHHRPKPQRTNRSHRGNSNRAGEVFVAGVIGGAIGRELSRSVNGRPNTGATIAGAVIGSALASSVVNHNSQNHSQRHFSSVNHTRSNHRDQYRHQRQNQRHGQHRQAGNRHNRQRCTTTMQTRTERQADGYRVTYQYRGHRYHTRTRQHPGNQLAIEVTLDPQRR